MNCEELRDNYELYALGVADESERAEIRAHLARECKTCVPGVKEARTFTALLGGTAALASPSHNLRKRILASVGVEQQRWRWAPVLAGAVGVLLLVVIYIGDRERRAADEALSRLHTELAQRSSELARLNDAFAIVNGPDTTEASFGQGQPTPPRGKVFVSPAQGVLLIASNLPPAPSGRIYEMWIIPKGGKPVAAGLFQSGSDRSAMHIQRGPIDVNATAAVAVTLENEGGAQQPTSQPLIVAALLKPVASQ